MRGLLLRFAALAATVVVLAGCGSSGGGSKTSAADWASGYCRAATSWVTTLESARKSVKTGNSPSNAAQTVTHQTLTFTQAVNGLGEPDTPNGSTSASTAKALTTKLQGRVARISAAAGTNNSSVTAAQRKTVVGEQVTASLSDVTTATAKLSQGDAELGKAMAASPDCAALSKALASAG